LRRVGLRDLRLVCLFERGALVRAQRIEERPQAGALEPLHDRARAGEPVDVGRLPDVHLAPNGTEPAVIVLEAAELFPCERRARKLAAPWPCPGDLAHQAVRRLVHVVRHLDGEAAAGPQEAREPGEKRPVVGHPLQDGVREDQVKRFRRAPRRKVRHRER
jgi:hypothetical protein